MAPWVLGWVVPGAGGTYGVCGVRALCLDPPPPAQRPLWSRHGAGGAQEGPDPQQQQGELGQLVSAPWFLGRGGVSHGGLLPHGQGVQGLCKGERPPPPRCLERTGQSRDEGSRNPGGALVGFRGL